MAKVKLPFFCQNCGAQYAKWQGQCNSCKEWNTIAEEIIQKKKRWPGKANRLLRAKPQSL
jgi:DNA repair protein RadA/Sms